MLEEAELAEWCGMVGSGAEEESRTRRGHEKGSSSDAQSIAALVTGGAEVG